jgi:hypothetical protein
MSSEGRLRKLGIFLHLDIYMAFLAQLVRGRAIVFELIHLPALPVSQQAKRSLPETLRKILILRGRRGICWLSCQHISLIYIELHTQVSDVTPAEPARNCAGE